jgi:PAS domain S-box-containing protein
MIIAITIVMYYPDKQRELFFEHEERELAILALNISNAIEVSFNHNDFSTLQKTIEFISKKKSFEFIAVITVDSLGNEELFNVIPPEKKGLAQRYDKAKYLVNESYFSTEKIMGKIIITNSRVEINKELAKLHHPIYSFLFTMMVVSLTIFYFITKRIAKPINYVTEIAKILESGNYNVLIEKSKVQDEVGLLQNAFYSLKESLLVQRNKNEELNKGLELKVEERTNELQQALNGLNQAQQTSKIGSYCFYSKEKSFSSSFTFNQILEFDNSTNYAYTECLNYIAPDDKQEVFSDIKKCIKNKNVFNKDFRIITGISKQVKWIHCLANVEYDTENKPVKFSGTIQDITERREIENELYKLSLVAKNTSNGVIITDKFKNIIWINDSITKISGYNIDELKGKTPKIFQFEETNLETLKFINEKIANYEPVKAEVKNRGKNGNVYWIELYIQPLYDNKKEVMGYMAIEIDITERKKHEAELEKLNKNLEERVISRTRDLEESYNNLQNVSYIISHDLKAPIRHTLFYSHLLK